MTAKRSEQPLLPNTYTIDQIDKMAKDWELGAFGMAMDARVRQIEKQQKLTFIELGYICLKVEETGAWEVMYGGGKFKSFAQWLTDAAPNSRATCYAALGAIKSIGDSVPIHELNDMPRCNVQVLAKVPKQDRIKPEIREAARHQDEQTFRRTIEIKIPNAHIETQSPMRFRPEKSQRKTIDAAIDAAILLEECSSREEALECICGDYLTSHQKEIEEAIAHA